MILDDNNKWLIDRIQHLEPKVQDFINKIIYNYAYEYLSIIEDCESPIEQLLVLALLDVADGRGLTHIGFYLEPQREIEILGKKYRVDICIYLGNITDLNSCKKLIIECDGHEFHEKTKEQAARDKQRDRMLMMAGYQIIHFTGSEIWADPYKCAREVIDLLLVH
ncbi:DUF559 domain-containing protein [Biomaibacter acetigenes]|uniref:DUF559 domain-containing protein n=1 Tax=Biomaibacter acetigenes TaxID=2316383 RepID=A0A3G2R5U5_9FIRM|nr:DUF559 domain-containing protein [Biomaibacter acetigenes]AYO30830.1 DUF559 domain-containing protein [Biomaibacter acetigenes]